MFFSLIKLRDIMQEFVINDNDFKIAVTKCEPAGIKYKESKNQDLTFV